MQALFQREVCLLWPFAYEQPVHDVDRYLQNAAERQAPAEQNRPARILVDAVVLDRLVLVDGERENARGDDWRQVLPTPKKTGAYAKAEHFGEVAVEALPAVEPGDHGGLKKAHPQQANSGGAVVIEKLEDVHAALVGEERERERERERFSLLNY